MSRHTPGPWKEDAWVGTDPYDDPDGPFVEVGNVRWSPNKVDVPAAIEQTANARLIAAAPELLEACEGLLNALPSATTHPAIKAARAAIAKAKGE
jgi:hypothetical protein